MTNPNFASLLWEQARSHPDKVAVVHREENVTFRELGDRAARIAGALLAAGIAPGDRVAVFLERGAEAAAAFFGTLATGAIVINVTELLRTRQIEHILNHSDAQLLVTNKEMLTRLPRVPEGPATKLMLLDEDGGEPLREVVPRIEKDACQIIYTSGSTGLPKGVTLVHGNLTAVTRVVVDYLGLSAEDRIASLLPFSYVYGLNQLFCSVGAGAALVIEQSPLERKIMSTLREQEVSVLACVPPLWLRLLDTPTFRDEQLPSLRVMTNAGGRIPPAAVKRLRTAQPHAELFLMYGMTETLRGTYLPPADVDTHTDSMGKAIPEAELMVLRDDGTECDPDEVGELVHRGPTVALGYWNDPEATAHVFRPNPLRPPGTPATELVVFSGDMVRRDADGFLYHHGRRDKMFKTLGHRVSPDEITDVLYSSDEVREAVVIPEEDELRGLKIVAHIVLLESGDLDRLVKYCKMELPRHMQPTQFRVWDELPRNASGKHDASQLAGKT